MLLHDILDLLLLEVLELILLHKESDLGTTANGRVDGVEGDSEGFAGSGVLDVDVLLIVVVLGDDLHTLGDEVRGVESDNELTDD